MELSQGALIGILAAVLAADILVVVIALAWTQIRRRRSRAAGAAATPPAGGAGTARTAPDRGLRVPGGHRDGRRRPEPRPR